MLKALSPVTSLRICISESYCTRSYSYICDTCPQYGACRTSRGTKQRLCLLNSRNTMCQLASEEWAGLLAREVSHISREMKDRERKLSFQWIPPYSLIPDNKRADGLAAAANTPDPTISMKRVQEARYLIHADVQRRHSHLDVSRRSPPNSAPSCRISRVASDLLHRLRVDYAFTRENLFIIGLADSPSCPRVFVEDTEHAISNSPSYTDARERIVRVARGAGTLCGSVENVHLP